MSNDPRFGWQHEPDAQSPAWADWPRCPHCRALRQTLCPTCRVPRSDFPLADLDPAADFPHTQDMAEACLDRHQGRGQGCCGGGTLMCSSARGEAGDEDGDEDLPDGVESESPSGGKNAGPTVLLLCPTCDEPFSPRFFRRCEDCGYDFGSGPERQRPVESDTNYRAVLVLFGLLALAAGVGAYFSWLFRK